MNCHSQGNGATPHHDDDEFWDSGPAAKHATAPGGRDPLFVGLRVGALIALLVWLGIAIAVWCSSGEPPAVPR